MEPTCPADRSNQEFEALLDAYRGALRRFAQRLEHGSEDAEDLFQESVIDAYRAFGKFRSGSNFYSWMTRIITNNHLDRLRKRRVKTISLEGTTLEGEAETLEVPDDSANPERSVLTSLFDPRLEDALDALLPAQRTTVMLCDLEGASYEEAAQAQGCPIGTVRSRLHRAHAALQRFLTGGFAAEDRLEEPVRTSRRNLLRMGTAMAAGVVLAPLAVAEPATAEPAEIRVRICPGEATNVEEDEVNGRLLRGLQREGRFRITGDGTGLTPDALDETDVLIVAGTAPQRRLPSSLEAGIARRVREGRLGLVVTGEAAAGTLLGRVLGSASFAPSAEASAAETLTVQVSAPRHPVASGVPTFTLPARVGASVAFEGTRPDVVVFRSLGPVEGTDTWQGMAWSVGRGRVFCFLPGSVPAEVYGQDAVSRALRNAVAWCGGPNG